MAQTLGGDFVLSLRSSETPMTQVGDTVRVSLLVTSFGVQKDPDTSLALSVTDPASSTTSVPSGSLVKDQEGKYHADIETDLAGTWSYTWTAVDTVLGTITKTGTFDVGYADVPVTITVQTTDVSPVPIEGAMVEVWSAANGKLVGSGLTNASGVFTCQATPGNYSVFCRAKQIAMTATSTALSIASTDVSVALTLTGTPLALTAPTAPRLVRIFGYLTQFDGRGFQALVSLVVVGRSPQFLNGGATGVLAQNLGLARTSQKVLADENGYWETDVLAGTVLSISLPELGYTKVVQVPDDPGVTYVNWRDLQAVPGTQEIGISGTTPGAGER